MNQTFTLRLLPNEYTVAKLAPMKQKLPELSTRSLDELVSITVSHDELSYIGPSFAVPKFTLASEGEWLCYCLDSNLPFDTVGVVAAITSCFAISGLSTFAISTHDRDYFLVRSADRSEAVDSLRRAGHSIIEGP